ncbi:YbfB/YjiJ family MFS transporter [Bordetella flabilis]
MLSIDVAIGIGRVAFTPPLPIMLRERWLTLDEACWLAAPCAMDSEVPVTLPAAPATKAPNILR